MKKKIRIVVVLLLLLMSFSTTVSAEGKIYGQEEEQEMTGEGTTTTTVGGSNIDKSLADSLYSNANVQIEVNTKAAKSANNISKTVVSYAFAFIPTIILIQSVLDILCVLSDGVNYIIQVTFKLSRFVSKDAKLIVGDLSGVTRGNQTPQYQNQHNNYYQNQQYPNPNDKNQEGINASALTRILMYGKERILLVVICIAFLYLVASDVLFVLGTRAGDKAKELFSSLFLK